MIRKFAIVVLALSMSAASANAMAPTKSHHMKHLHMMAMCANGQVRAHVHVLPIQWARHGQTPNVQGRPVVPYHDRSLHPVAVHDR